ncbi:hypothetical protein [Aeromicrobium sp. 179-A 4D2 NHS]|uniref:hypothetical protein n=1 Tax=Aeromicrobium sp. 179-A 4D2 NHS TaxID=3142375 RepID=UPI0039A3C7ED
MYALVDDLESEHARIEKRLRRAQVAALATQIHEQYPEVASLEYAWRENPDTIIPPLAATFDVDGEVLPQMITDDLNRNFRSGLGIGFGDHVEGQVIDLHEASQPGYLDGIANPPASRAEAIGWPSLGGLMDDAKSRGLINDSHLDELDDDELNDLGHRYVGSTIVSIISGYSHYESDSTIGADEMERFRVRSESLTGSKALGSIWECVEGSSVPSGMLDRMTDGQIRVFHSAHVRGPAAKMADEIKALLNDK